jgi:hypothetical protein
MTSQDIPGRTTVADEIYAKSLKVKGPLQQFSICDSLTSFTFDAGTSKAYDPFLTVTAHWINNNWQLCEQVIAFTVIEGEHTGRNIGAMLSRARWIFFFLSFVLRWSRTLDSQCYQKSVSHAGEVITVT